MVICRWVARAAVLPVVFTAGWLQAPGVIPRSHGSINPILGQPLANSPTVPLWVRAPANVIKPQSSVLKASGSSNGMPALSPNYGETQGGAVLFKDLSIVAGANLLMRDVNLKINTGERVGIVGRNGVGKSTLLSVLAGQMLPDKGTATVHPRAQLGYLVQTAVSGSSRPLVDEVMSQMTRYHAAKAGVEDAQALIEKDPSDANLLAFERAQAEFEEAGGLDVESRVASILAGLGFKKEDHTKPCTEFSGGWQMRIALARLLLGEPSLLLLDEPTNHLDSSAKNWLMGFLSMYPGTVLLVSHEESLLRDFRCTAVAEVRDQELHVFRCEYDKFVLQRVEREEAARRAFEAQQREIAKLQGYIDRFGAKASLASSANSRKKTLDKMEKLAAPVTEARRPKLVIPDPPKVWPEVIRLHNATVGYDERSAPLFEKVDITITRGSRVVLLGPNGCGKSTMLRALTGALPLQHGERSTGEGLELGVFTQDLAQDLPQEAIAVEHVLEVVRQKDPLISDQQARAALGALGLMGEKALRPISALSGGEKARVALALFMLIPHNVLVLDEPSNHLDVATVEVLTQALAEFKGTLIVVSHNQPFVEALRPTHIGQVRGKTMLIEERMLRPSDWAMDGEEASQPSKAAPTKASSGKAAAAAAPADDGKPKMSYAAQRALFKKISAAPKRIAKIEQLIAETEKKVSEYEAGMYQAGSDVTKVMELSERKERAQAEVAKLYAEWEELEALVASAPESK